MRRRRVLAGAIPAVSLPLVGGCVAQSRDESDPQDDHSPALESKGPVRGESDADVEVTEVEDDEDVEYVAEDDAVRYVSAWRNTNPTEMEEGEPPEREPVYDTVPFERWAKTNGLTVAARAAADHASDELDIDGVGSGVTSTIEGRDRTAFVATGTTLDRDGNVISEPVVGFEALVEATPATVDATYRFDGQEYELEAPIYAQHFVEQQT